jgi:6-pyruvoyltetrahydropterin/6-carboxytetrahydropterin synthase
MVEGTFDAAHQLIGYDGPCEKLHGHTWKAQVFIKGTKLNDLGMVRDFKELKLMLQFALSNLNVHPYFKKINPTSENVAKYIFDQIAKKADVTKVTVFESATTSASYVR